MTRRNTLAAVQWLTAVILSLVGAFGAFGIPVVSAAVNTDGWELEAVACPSGGGLAVGEFVGGPAVPPSGSGSLEIRIASDGKGWFQVRYPQLTNIALSSITTLQYSTYVETPNTSAAPYLTLSIDLTGDGIPDDQLIFEPSKNGTVTSQTWQTWDALNGLWWSPNGTAGLTRGHPQPLSTYLAQNPTARLASAPGMPSLMLAAGCLSGYAWNNWQGSIDNVLFSGGGITMTWDFEPTGVISTAPPPPSLVTGPILSTLTPKPWTTVSPGKVQIAFSVVSPNPITTVTALLATGPTASPSQPLTMQVNGLGTFQAQASAMPSLQPGLYTVRVTVQDSQGHVRRTTWPFVVSTNIGDSWWFLADGTPRREAIEATLRSLVEAFRWHLYGETWDGQPHADIPTHVSLNAGAIHFDGFAPDRYATLPPGEIQLAVHVTADSPLRDVTLWLNGQPLSPEKGGPSETSLAIFTTQPLTAGSYGLRATAIDAAGHQLTTTWSFIISNDPGESAWFFGNGTLKAATTTRTLKALVEAFRWHLWGISWDGQAHTELPTHATNVSPAQPLPTWFDSNGQPNQQALSDTLRSLVEVFRWHFWGESWDGQPHPEVPTHAS